MIDVTKLLDFSPLADELLGQKVAQGNREKSNFSANARIGIRIESKTKNKTKVGVFNAKLNIGNKPTGIGRSSGNPIGMWPSKMHGGMKRK